LRVPSPLMRRNEFGMRKAARKASELKPAPKIQAIMASRTNPRIRLNTVASATTHAARVSRRSSGSDAEGD
jgi:hypothetical protein